MFCVHDISGTNTMLKVNILRTKRILLLAGHQFICLDATSVNKTRK